MNYKISFAFLAILCISVSIAVASPTAKEEIAELERKVLNNRVPNSSQLGIMSNQLKRLDKLYESQLKFQENEEDIEEIEKKREQVQERLAALELGKSQMAMGKLLRYGSQFATAVDLTRTAYDTAQSISRHNRNQPFDYHQGDYYTGMAQPVAAY